MGHARAFAHCDRPLPCRPGESPFHIKGEFYRQLSTTIEVYDQRSKGAVRAAIARSELAQFLSQKFLSSSLYDVLPIPRVFMLLAEVLDRDVYELTSHLGKSAIEMSMSGVYESLFARLTPQNFADRFGTIIPHIYDHGAATVTRAPDGKGGSLVREGVPSCVAEWWCVVTVPFVEVPLAANGARDIEIEWKIDPRGTRGNIPLSRVSWKIHWA